MNGPQKRLPGQSDADYGRGSGPNGNFIHTGALHGGTDLTFGVRLMDAITRWLKKRRQNR